MLKTNNEKFVIEVISCLPEGLCDEILRISRGRRCGLCSLSEISLRVGGRCTLLADGEKLPLLTALSAREMDLIYERLMGGALYAAREGIASGYLTLPGGSRVGVCGYAGYDGGVLSGVSRISSLLFRIPRGECAFAEELFFVYRQGIGSGMLIYSRPGVGKTTALRSLAGYAGRGQDAVRVVVIDERCEFCEDDYVGAEVDILKGYKRTLGMEIATRTMSAGLIMLDELSGDDIEGLLRTVGCGVPIIATAHASGYDELMSRPALADILSSGVFKVFFGIDRSATGYTTRVDRI